LIHAIVREIVVLVALLTLYQIVFKASHWRSRLLQLVIPRTRITVYLLFISFSVWRILTHVPATHWKPVAMDVAQGAVSLLVSVLIIELIHLGVFDYLLEQRQQINVPYIFRDLVRASLYGLAVILLFRYNYNIDVTSLVAASGVLAIMLGFALQTVMSDFFAGMSMQMTRPYSLGDWVRVGEKEGRVEHIDWRATVLRTFYHDHLVIPNGKLAHEAIINFSQPTTLHLHNVVLYAHYRNAPGDVDKAVREALQGVQHIHHDRGYVIVMDGFEASSVRWKVKFWLSDYSEYMHVESDVRKRLWYAFQRAGLEMPAPQLSVTHLSPEPDDVQSTALRLFSRIDWLSALSDEDRRALAEKVQLVRYGKDECVVRQGDPGESLFLIRHGRVEVRAKRDDQTIFMRKTMTDGEFFGEISALTGQPRSADVVALEDSALLVVHKEALRQIVADDAELICSLLVRREELIQQREESLAHAATEGEQVVDKASLSSELFKKIRDFFAF
jgi:small-conductance mechanosensitive channel